MSNLTKYFYITSVTCHFSIKKILKKKLKTKKTNFEGGCHPWKGCGSQVANALPKGVAVRRFPSLRGGFRATLKSIWGDQKATPKPLGVAAWPPLALEVAAHHPRALGVTFGPSRNPFGVAFKPPHFPFSFFFSLLSSFSFF